MELSTAGDGKLLGAIYAAMGRQSAREMVEVRGASDGVTVLGYAGKSTANRGTRGYQHFFVNGRYVKSKMMAAALEEAYKNQMMVGRFPICVLHIQVPPAMVDVNVHPAKTEVKFLREGDVFDAIHYTVLGALSCTPDRPEMALSRQQAPGKGDFYQSMTAQEYRAATANETQRNQQESNAAMTKQFLATLAQRAEQPIPQTGVVRDSVRLAPGRTGSVQISSGTACGLQGGRPAAGLPAEVPAAGKPWSAPAASVQNAEQVPVVSIQDAGPASEQTVMDMPTVPRPEMPAPQRTQMPKKKSETPYRIIGQTMDTYIIIEQGDNLLLIDKHAAHERILFEKLKTQPARIMSQMLLQPLQADLSREESAVLLEKTEELETLGFTVEDFGGGTLLVRAIPCDIDEKDAEPCLAQLAQNYQEGLRMDPETVHDNLLHTIACKAAIKGGRKTDPVELAALTEEVMARDDIKYCPHGRPVCITLTRAALERQFKRA